VGIAVGSDSDKLDVEGCVALVCLMPLKWDPVPAASMQREITAAGTGSSQSIDAAIWFISLKTDGVKVPIDSCLRLRRLTLWCAGLDSAADF
jgi:hypothetical protein